MAIRITESDFEMNNKMAMRILPSDISLSSIDEDVSETITLTNKSDQMLMYKVRLPPSRVLDVSKPMGTIPPHGTFDLDVMYYESKNVNRDCLFSMQVKYLQLEGDETEDKEVFNKKKDKVSTKYVNVSFTDFEDDMFKSPQVSSKSTLPTDNKPTTWWGKRA